MCGYGHLDDSLRIVFLRYLDKMTPKEVSRAEVQQGVEECAALIAAQLSCLLNPKTKCFQTASAMAVNFAALRFSAMHFCGCLKAWPFVHDRLAKRAWLR